MSNAFALRKITSFADLQAASDALHTLKVDHYEAELRNQTRIARDRDRSAARRFKQAQRFN